MRSELANEVIEAYRNNILPGGCHHEESAKCASVMSVMGQLALKENSEMLLLHRQYKAVVFSS